MKNAKSQRWTRWHDIAVSAVMLGIVPDFSVGSMNKLNKKLNRLVADGDVVKLKHGTAQSAKAEYRPNYEYNRKTGRRERPRRAR